MTDLENIKARCESRANYDMEMIELVKEKVFKRIDPESFLPTSDMSSPRVSNLYYKPILNYIYYVLSFVSLK